MSLIVITGSMFAGKTTTLLRYLECARIADQKVVLYKPETDTRVRGGVQTHSGAIELAIALPAEPPHGWTFDPAEVYGFDEAQFLGSGWLALIDQLASDKEVVCSCLNQDCYGVPFGIAPSLLAMADNIVHIKAVCMSCKAKDVATKTHRTMRSSDMVVIGGSDKYMALCRDCWYKARFGG